MNLPRTKFADSNGVWRQFFHLVSEVWEVFKALVLAEICRRMYIGYWWRHYEQAARELVDVQISAHTERYILHDKYWCADMESCEKYVFRKGVERGYYKRKDVFPIKEGWQGAGAPPSGMYDVFEVLLDNGTIRTCQRNLMLDYNNLYFTDCNHPLQNMYCNDSYIDQWRVKS